MMVEENPNLAREVESSEDEDIEDETYVPSPRAHSHGRGKGLASGSGSGRAGVAAKIEEENDNGNDGEEEEKVFDVEEINPPNDVDMGPFVFRVPSNPTWTVKVSYKGKTESVRENRRIHACIQP
jgi:hypothetical protein